MAVGVLVALVGVLMVWGHLWISAEARLARYLDVSDTSSEETIERDLLQRFPVGMSLQDVRKSLETRGLRQGGGSTRYYLSADSGIEQKDPESATAIACVFDYNSGFFVFGEEYYYVWFGFDANQRLESVAVKRGVSAL